MALTVVHCGQAGLLGSYEASTIKDNGVPVPNNEDAIEWWIQQAEEDVDKVLGILAHLQTKGMDWVDKLIDVLAVEL